MSFLLDYRSKRNDRVLVNKFNPSYTYKYYFKFFFDLFLKRKELFKRKRRPFVYRIDLIERRVFFKRKKSRYMILRLVKFYYSFLTYKQFKKLNRIAKRKSGLYEQYYVLFLEGRLVNFLYRSSFVESIFRSFFYIRGNFITINWRVCGFHNQRVKLYDVISFHPIILYDIMCNFFFRLSMRLVLNPPLRFMYISYFFFFFFAFKMPRKKDIPNRRLIDMQRLVGYPILF